MFLRTKDRILNKITYNTTKILQEINRTTRKVNLEKVKTADTIEELCDEFVCQENDNFYWLASRENVSFRDLPNCYCKAIFGAIWTDKGLIYVAKMNDKGELKLL